MPSVNSSMPLSNYITYLYNKDKKDVVTNNNYEENYEYKWVFSTGINTTTDVYLPRKIYPTLYLNSNIYVKSRDETSDNPFQIK